MRKHLRGKLRTAWFSLIFQSRRCHHPPPHHHDHCRRRRRYHHQFTKKKQMMKEFFCFFSEYDKVEILSVKDLMKSSLLTIKQSVTSYQPCRTV